MRKAFILTGEKHFNPLPPHGGRHGKQMQTLSRSTFQSTPSAWRETDCSKSSTSIMIAFQSTPSAWRETILTLQSVGFSKISIHSLRMEGDRSCRVRAIVHIPISIHSLRMEGDPALQQSVLLWCNFNPLPPHGGRRIWCIFSAAVLQFQSTPSAWRETHIWSLLQWV